MPNLSRYYISRKPSDNRMAQMEFANRKDGVRAINVSVGNVTLPMHPKMLERTAHLCDRGAMFADGVVKYTPTVGLEETQSAFKNILESSGYSTEGLFFQITDGGSLAMELMILGVCDPSDKPLLVIDAVYTNYLLLAKRTCRKTVSIQRALRDDGTFSFPNEDEIEDFIKQNNPAAILVIPYDNPTGQLYDYKTLKMIARLCIKYDLRLVSDEAYRELYFQGESISVWGFSEEELPGITGRRISIESASKVRNACGLRIGGIITDNKDFHEKCVAEQTANLCANTLGQYIFAALAHESKEDLSHWYAKQREYYQGMFHDMKTKLMEYLPGIIVADSQAAIYTVIDVKNIVPSSFDAKDFALFCAREGSVKIDNQIYILLVSPLAGFYQVDDQSKNPGNTQMRIAFVESPEVMAMVPFVFAELFRGYTQSLRHSLTIE